MIKGKLIMMIATVVLLLAGLVSASLSWYTSQEQVSGENASVGAEESITASINSTLIEVSHYSGETGKAPSTHEDAPYSVDISLSLFASALEETTHLKITLTSLTVGTGTIEETEKYIFETNTPEDDMTIRVLAGESIYKLNNDGYLDIIQIDMAPEDNMRAKVNMSSALLEDFESMISEGLHHQYKFSTLFLNRGITKNNLPYFLHKFPTSFTGLIIPVLVS